MLIQTHTHLRLLEAPNSATQCANYLEQHLPKSVFTGLCPAKGQCLLVEQRVVALVFMFMLEDRLEDTRQIIGKQ